MVLLPPCAFGEVRRGAPRPGIYGTPCLIEVWGTFGAVLLCVYVCVEDIGRPNDDVVFSREFVQLFTSLVASW